jgi:hypothetical protein
VNEYTILLGVLVAVIVYSIRDGLLIWLVFRWAFGRTSSAVVPSAGPGPAGPVPLPGPAPAPVPVPPPTARFTGITATSFGGAGDSNASAYGGIVDPNSSGVALPFHFTGTRPTVRVFYGGKSVDCQIVDVGPWNVSDPYWQTGARPQAESGTDKTGRVTNLAGIDLTPAAWTALGVSNPNSVKTTVDWDFVSYLDAPPATATSGTTPATQTTPAAPIGDPPWLVEARKHLGSKWTSGPPPQWMSDLIDGIKNNAANKNAPGFAAYCDQFKTGYFEWCGIFAAGVLASAGKSVPYVQGQDTSSYAWAPAWDSYGTAVTDPIPGDMIRYGWSSGGEHITMYESLHGEDDYYHCIGGNQTGQSVSIAMMPMDSEVKAIRRAP